MTPAAVEGTDSPGNVSHVGIDDNTNSNNHDDIGGPQSRTSAFSAERKRKASDSSNSRPSSQRQKITRACDYCKEKKTRCTGTLPCMRCTRLSLACEYSAAYSRGLPPDPLPAPPSSSSMRAKDGGGIRQRASSAAGRANQSPLTPRSAKGSPRDVISTRQGYSRHDPAVSPRNSPDPVATDFEGNYLGPASGVSFINRVWSRLHQDETSAIPDELQNESSSKNTSVFMFGDKPYSNYQETGFTLPSYERALELVGIYFDFSIVTYRFLHRGSVEAWLRQVYENNVSFSNLPTGCMVARTSIILMTFAVATLYNEQQPGNFTEGMGESERWYAASKYMSSIESGPPRLETIQARLGQCLYLLSSSRANECWYAYGTALQLVTALGLHRRCPAKLSKSPSSYLEQELRKRIFWSAYTLDKYLSVMFGRPRLLHDEDIDQGLPDEMNDDDMLQEDPARRTGSPDSMMTASVLHYRLGRILGEISRQLYTINPHSREPPLETAARLTSELEKWKESAPPLFNSVRASSLIPPLCRQSQVLQFAFSHAMIHATRSFLLNDFTDLSRRPPIPHPMVTCHVQKCIEAAEDTISLVDSLAKQGILSQSFWFTHYVCFCAIMVVYIHTIQQHRQSSTSEPSQQKLEDKSCYLFNLAEACQRHLAEATRKNCPSRRYGIILEELRLEVHRQIGSPSQSGHTTVTSENAQPRPQPQHNIESPMDQTLTPTNVEQPIALDPSTAMNYPSMSGGFQSSDLTDGPFDPNADLGLLDNLEGSIWWAQLDSWAFSSFPNDPSAITF